MAPKTLPMVLGREEVERLFRVPNTGCPTGLRNRAILSIMEGSGLRVSEVISLRPSHIHWDEKPRAIVELHDCKGHKDRNVPIFEETLGWLRAWQEKRPTSAYFFCTLKGRRLSARYLEEAVKRYARKAGLERWKRVTPHTLRHTCATRRLAEGFNVYQVQKLLGHKNLGSTQVYLHVAPRELAEQFAQVEDSRLVTNAALPNQEPRPRDLMLMAVRLLEEAGRQLKERKHGQSLPKRRS